MVLYCNIFTDEINLEIMFDKIKNIIKGLKLKNSTLVLFLTIAVLFIIWDIFIKEKPKPDNNYIELTAKYNKLLSDVQAIEDNQTTLSNNNENEHAILKSEISSDYNKKIKFIVENQKKSQDYVLSVLDMATTLAENNIKSGQFMTKTIESIKENMKPIIVKSIEPDPIAKTAIDTIPVKVVYIQDTIKKKSIFKKILYLLNKK
jgi:hypothetical protein